MNYRQLINTNKSENVQKKQLLTKSQLTSAELQFLNSLNNETKRLQQKMNKKTNNVIRKEEEKRELTTKEEDEEEIGRKQYTSSSFDWPHKRMQTIGKEKKTDEWEDREEQHRRDSNTTTSLSSLLTEIRERKRYRNDADSGRESPILNIVRDVDELELSTDVIISNNQHHADRIKYNEKTLIDDDIAQPAIIHTETINESDNSYDEGGTGERILLSLSISTSSSRSSITTIDNQTIEYKGNDLMLITNNNKTASKYNSDRNVLNSNEIVESDQKTNQLQTSLPSSIPNSLQYERNIFYTSQQKLPQDKEVEEESIEEHINSINSSKSTIKHQSIDVINKSDTIDDEVSLSSTSSSSSNESISSSSSVDSNDHNHSILSRSSTSNHAASISIIDNRSIVDRNLNNNTFATNRIDQSTQTTQLWTAEQFLSMYQQINSSGLTNNVKKNKKQSYPRRGVDNVSDRSLINEMLSLHIELLNKQIDQQWQDYCEWNKLLIRQQPSTHKT